MKIKTIAGCMFLFLLSLAFQPQYLHAQQLELYTEKPREDALGPKPDTSALTGLRFVTEGDYPPFNYYDEDGQLTGFNVDMARAVCRELEVGCEITSTAWENLLPSLKSGDADAAIASLAITPQNLTQADFTDGYYNTPARFAYKTGTEVDGVTPEALDGRSIGVVEGTAHEAYLRDFFEEADIKTFKTPQDVRDALKKGDVELIFADVVSLLFWTNGQDSEGCCQLLPGGFNEPRYFGEGVSIAVAKGNRDLVEILNYGLAKVRTSGRYEEIFSKYFPSAFY